MNIRRGSRGRSGVAMAVAAVLACGALQTASADSRGQDGRTIAAGMAEVDSLLVVDPAAAVVLAGRLYGTYGDDPLYGWQVRGRLASALMADDRPAEALPHLETLVRLDPHDPVGHRNLAAALRKLGKRGRALTEYGVVVELAPRDYRARLEYGQYLLEFRNLALAAAHLEEADRLCGGCEEAQRALVNLYLARGDFASAADPLLEIAKTDTTEALRRSLLAALSRSGRDSELLGYLEQRGIARLNDEELRLVVDAEGNLARDDHSLAFAGSLAGNEKEGTGTPGHLPDQAGFWGRVALNLLETGRLDESLLAVDRAIELDGEDVTHRNNRVVILQGLGRDEEAAREWEEVLRLEPSLEQEKTP